MFYFLIISPMKFAFDGHYYAIPQSNNKHAIQPA